MSEGETGDAAEGEAAGGASDEAVRGTGEAVFFRLSRWYMISEGETTGAVEGGVGGSLDEPALDSMWKDARVRSEARLWTPASAACVPAGRFSVALSDALVSTGSVPAGWSCAVVVCTVLVCQGGREGGVLPPVC